MKPRDPPPRLIEALEYIQKSGNLKFMQDVTVPQLDRLWQYIQGNGLAVVSSADRLWALTGAGLEAVTRPATTSLQGTENKEAGA